MVSVFEDIKTAANLCSKINLKKWGEGKEINPLVYSLTQG